MRHIILILFLCLTSYSQNVRINNTHNINLLLPKIVINDPEIITLRPINKIKVTFKVGLNVPNDDSSGFYHMIGYECRVKYYVNKKFRLVFKNQVLSIGENYYFMGFQFKF